MQVHVSATASTRQHDELDPTAAEATTALAVYEWAGDEPPDDEEPDYDALERFAEEGYRERQAWLAYKARRLAALRPAAAPTPAPESGGLVKAGGTVAKKAGGKRRKPSDEQTAKQVLIGCEPWMSSDGGPYVTDLDTGDHIYLRDEERGFHWYLRQCQKVEAAPQNYSAWKNKLLPFVIFNAVQAGERGATFPTQIRAAREAGEIWIDLGEKKRWAVHVTRDGWRVELAPPSIKFLRPADLAPLPRPAEPGTGSLDPLWAVLNVREGDRPLVRGWLLDALKGFGPYQIMVINGGQGSAKSTVSRFLKAVVDPVTARNGGVNRPPKIGDLQVTARHTHCLAYDNLSKMTQELSDEFCRLATGGGGAERLLYTNAGLFTFDAVRPLLLNGIPAFAKSDDFLDRALKLVCPPLLEGNERTEDDVKAAFAAGRPAVFGALCDLLVVGLRNASAGGGGVTSRMADSMAFISACESELPPDAPRFGPAFLEMRQHTSYEAIDAQPVAVLLLEWLRGDGDTYAGGKRACQPSWVGSPKTLQAVLKGYDPEAAKVRGFPAQPNDVKEVLQRVGPAMARHGVKLDLELKRNKHGERLGIDAVEYLKEAVGFDPDRLAEAERLLALAQKKLVAWRKPGDPGASMWYMLALLRSEVGAAVTVTGGRTGRVEPRTDQGRQEIEIARQELEGGAA